MNVIMHEQVKSFLTKKTRWISRLLYKLPFIQYPYSSSSLNEKEDNIFQYLWDNIYKTVKWKWQKKTRGYDDCDLWNLYSHFNDLIIPRLKAFRTMKKMGYPSQMSSTDETGLNDVPGFDWRKDAEVEHEDGHCDKNYQKWLSIIDKMILAFEYSKDDMESFEPDFKYPETYFKPCEDHPGCSTLEHKFIDEKHKKDYEAHWERYKAEMARREKVIDEGMRLFAKYYRSLWD